MVYSPAGSGSITVNESNKISGSNNYQFRPTGTATASNQLRTTLNYIEPGTGFVMVNDGNVINYASRFSNAIDEWDAIKPNNFVENFGIYSGNQKISIERRAPITWTDTIQYDMWKMRVRKYQLEFAFDDLTAPAGTAAYLEDMYLNTKTPIRMTDTTRIDFDVTADVASAAEYRFRMTFNPSVKYNNIKAYIQNRDIAVEWGVSEEVNLKEYEVERSTDGVHFIKQTARAAVGNSPSPVNYIWLDKQPAAAKVYYYRVKSISNFGVVLYSDIVKVTLPVNKTDMYVINNPVEGNSIQLQMNSIDNGSFAVRLINNAGQVVYTGNIVHAQGTSTETIELGNAFPKGVYQLEVIAMNGKKRSFAVMVK